MIVDTQKENLLLHICCAPCSTHAIELLKKKHIVTGYFYNPNLFPPAEHDYRLNETKSYLTQLNIPLISPTLDRTNWLQSNQSRRNEKEGGKRCCHCFQLRLEETAKTCKKIGMNLFTTTLTIGPNKPASVIFPIGRTLATKYGLSFLEIDFKKKDGFKHSCRLSREAGMYRQDYCGCEYSLRDRNIRISNRDRQV